MLLDYHRFRADSIASFAGDQVRIISEAQEAASIPRSSQEITTNSPGGVWDKAMNPNLFFDEMLDFVSYDDYPVCGGTLELEASSLMTMQLDMVRCWGRSGQLLRQLHHRRAIDRRPRARYYWIHPTIGPGRGLVRADSSARGRLPRVLLISRRNLWTGGVPLRETGPEYPPGHGTRVE